MEEKKSKSSSVILTILLILVLALGGFVAYDKLLKDNKDNTQNDKTVEETVTSNVDIKHLLSLVIIKRDSNENVVSYKTSNLTDSDINDIICGYVVQDENVVDNNGYTSFRMKASEVESAIKELYGIEKDKFNLKAGANNYGVHNLKTIEENGIKYYKTERKEGAWDSIPNDDMFHYGLIRNVSYKDDILSIECDVEKLVSETPYYELLGAATIKFNISNGIRFLSFAFTKEEIINTYVREVVME